MKKIKSTRLAIPRNKRLARLKRTLKSRKDTLEGQGQGEICEGQSLISVAGDNAGALPGLCENIEVV